MMRKQNIYRVNNRKWHIFGYEWLCGPTTSIKDDLASFQQVTESIFYLISTGQYNSNSKMHFVNVNAKTLEYFTPFVIDRIKRYNLQNHVVIEVLEGEASVSDSIKELHEHGIKVALDDFGCGSSNLDRYIDNMQYISFMKVDRPFWTAFPMLFKTSDLFRSVHIIAEKVETKEEFDMLLEHNIAFMQGYYLSQPQPVKSDIISV